MYASLFSCYCLVYSKMEQRNLDALLALFALKELATTLQSIRLISEENSAWMPVVLYEIQLNSRGDRNH